MIPGSLRELLRQLDEQGIRDHRRYQTVKRYIDMKARERGTPVSGTFELTPLCNLDCKMCYVHLAPEQMRGAGLLSVAEWKDIMRQAVDAGMMYANLTGGECLTYPGFKELYLYLRSMGVETHILSNGVLMDEEMVGFLRENKPSMIQITLYGASEDGYERVTGHRYFQRVMENIRRLKEAGLPLAVGITPNEFMMDGVEIIDILDLLDIPTVINAGLMIPREETGRVLADAELDMYIAMIRHRRELGGEIEEELPDPEELPDVGGDGRSETGVRCGAGRSTFAIDWHGGMRPCNNFPCESKNVMDIGFAEAWRHIHDTATHYPQPAECHGCKYEDVCKHCVAEHAAGASPGHASTKICAWGRRMAAEGLVKLS